MRDKLWGGGLAVVMVLLGPTPSPAQTPAPVEVGARVRLTLPGKQRVKGMLVGRIADSLEIGALEPARVGSIRVGLRDVVRIEVSTGRRHPMGKSMLIGTGIGGAVGALVGAVEPLCEPKEFLDCLMQSTDRDEAIATGAVALGVAGFLTGTIIGAIGHEGWAPASLPDWRPTVTARRGMMAIGIWIALR